MFVNQLNYREIFYLMLVKNKSISVYAYQIGQVSCRPNCVRWATGSFAMLRCESQFVNYSNHHLTG